MRTRLEVLISSLISLVISFNLLLYSLQRYSPPEADSPSFSVLDCTSHKNPDDLSAIIDLITGSEGESGSEKHCLCHTCCCPGYNLEVSKPVTADAVYYDESRYPSENDSAFSEDFNNNIPIRSPPAA